MSKFKVGDKVKVIDELNGIVNFKKLETVNIKVGTTLIVTDVARLGVYLDDKYFTSFENDLELVDSIKFDYEVEYKRLLKDLERLGEIIDTLVEYIKKH